MKLLYCVSVAGLAWVAGSAYACDATGAASKVSLSALLGNRYACATRSGESWNDLHQGSPSGFSGNVQDYKRGPADPVDPSTVVGTYTINQGTAGGPDSITYNYGSGGTFSYIVKPNATTAGVYTFCNVATSQIISVTVSASHC
jgi:hypothetical protein